MRKDLLGIFSCLVSSLCLFSLINLGWAEKQSAQISASVAKQGLSVKGQQDFIDQNCSYCHNDLEMAGNMSLSELDLHNIEKNPKLVEAMIRKLRASLMPPAGATRPKESAIQALAASLETRIDKISNTKPDPGSRSFQRLNRAEYEQAISDLLGLDVDSNNWLPLDQMLANFDNMADAQMLSPTLLEAYLNAAAAISRMAIGDKYAPPIDETYTNSQYISQHPWDYVPGAPYGTRGGMVVDHVFPADGEYIFQLTFTSGDNTRVDDVDISINGRRVGFLMYDPHAEGEGADGRGGTPIQTEPIQVAAGQQRVSAAFIRRLEGPYEDLIRPHDWSYAGGGAGGPGITTLPHLRDLIVKGPYNTTGLSNTPTRQKVFSCRPTEPAEERPCARKIASRLASEAYRRSLSAADLDGLMQFYDAGAQRGGFELGIRETLEAILASPHFVLRVEREPTNVEPGKAYRVTDLDLASRLSFFLWGTTPDEELQRLAMENKLSADGELERQARRMLMDARSAALGERFASQWLRLQDIFKVHPDPNFYPNFDDNLANAMRQETETFFNFLVRENRSVLELYSADYTFANERLARHYDFPSVAGNKFRIVKYPDTNRKGLLGHGSVLVLTSLANRTSPVLRGKWVMEVLMGTPPPPPPPDIPALEETSGSTSGRLLSTRERMALHRENPTCNACHRLMDPIGLALDNFDVTAKWRLRENGSAIDTQGEFYDGSFVSSPSELAKALLKRPIPLVRTFTENLMTYALGRPVEHFDQPTIRAIARKAEIDGYRISSFILGIIDSPAFQMKRAGPKVFEGIASGKRQ